MIGSSTPGISAEAWGAELRARTDLAREHQPVAAMVRELRSARTEARRARRTAYVVRLGRRPARRVGRLTHGSAA